MSRLWSRSRLLVSGLLVSSALSAPVSAFVWEVDPGEAPKLKADEGLLVVSVDTSTGLEQVKVKRIDAVFSSANLRKVGKGHEARLYRLPAGEYRWDQVRSPFVGLRYDLSDDVEYRFTVKPGVVNYAGDLVYRPIGVFSALLHVSNRGLRVLDWLENTHPAVLAQHRFEYTGHYPDPFPAFYADERKLRRKRTAIADSTLPLPTPEKTSVSVRDLWRASRVQAMSLNPMGTLYAEVVNDGEQWLVDLFDLQAASMVRLVRSPYRIDDVWWSGDDRLLVSAKDAQGFSRVWVLIASPPPAQPRTFTRFELPAGVFVVDALENDPNHALVGSRDRNGALMVHRIDIGSEAAAMRFRYRAKDRLNRGVEDDESWIADASGALRLAIATREDKIGLYFGRDGEFAEVMRLDNFESFRPLALSADATVIFGTTNSGRPQRELVEFDLRTRTIARTLFAKPGYDVEVGLFDGPGQLIGVGYRREGQLVSEYFDATQERLNRSLRQAFVDRTVVVFDRSLRGDQLILGVSGSDQPTRIYHFDVASKRAVLLDETMPWLAGRKLARAVVVRARSADGFDVEGFLSLPATGSGRRPLVVLPHGGPVGVADTRDFDPEVQFLASLGYAVLQVNFRGSAGYGRSFEEAGHRRQGTAIEDDIVAVLDRALADHPLDSTRICAVGTSYGGYSSLVMAIRWPERFRCVVSISGVSDRALFFTASDGGRSARGREELETALGDPRTDGVAMRATSPTFRYRDLKAPVMLVHGTEDLRVDYEHTRRLVRMLNLAGRPPVLIRFNDEGHGVVKIDNQEVVWTTVAGFLARNLVGIGTTMESSSASAETSRN